MPAIERRNYDVCAIQYSKIEGQTFGHLTAIEQTGFLGSMAVWRYACDCGNECERRAAFITYAASHPERRESAGRLHCGCRNVNQRHGLSGTPVHRLWVSLRARKRLCPGWYKNLAQFNEECYKTKDAQFLNRIVRSGLLGPGNFFWSEKTEAHYDTLEEAAEVLVKHQGMTPAEAMARVRSISRQRCSQILNKYSGKCTVCGTPRTGSSVAYCERCRLKQNSYQRKKTRTQVRL